MDQAERGGVDHRSVGLRKTTLARTVNALQDIDAGRRMR
ncbi:hypothetical protein BGLA2_700125 [Burkholderia gladioli]|nr:hypothetical protein BGLA2_700125 [Burkholderia gladioli]